MNEEQTEEQKAEIQAERDKRNEEFCAKQAAERKARFAEFNKKIKAISGALFALGVPCVREAQEEPSDVWARIDLKEHEGQGLSLRRDYKNRLEVHGSWPSTRSNTSHEQFIPREDVAGITVDFNRDASAIARDIARRFLPKYREQFAAQLVRKASSEKYASDTKNLAEGFARELGETVSGHAKGTVYFYNHCHGELVCSGNSVSADLRSITVEQAAQLVALIKTWKRAE